MVVPFGFSVGDCIAVSLLIKDAVLALDNAHGAAAEYQELIRELWALDRALLEVMNVSQGFETTVKLNALSHATRRTREGSGSRWRDATGRIGWAILKGDEVKAFRTEICAHSQAINMMLITASVSLAKLNNTNLRERMDDSRRTQEEKAEDQLVAIRQVNDTINNQSKALQKYGDTISRLDDGIKYFRALGNELKTFMSRVLAINLRSYNILVDLQTRVPREFGPCWIQEPLIFTDGLGRVTPIHLELINSWPVLDAVLTARFQDMPGEKMIKRKEFALQNRGSLLDVDRSVSFHVSFLPGRKVDMSMIFEETIAKGGQLCPGCGAKSIQDGQSAITCPCCGLWFQRVEELVDHSDIPAMKKALNATKNPADATNADSVSKESREIDSSKKRGPDTDLADSMTLFKRVRILRTRHTYKARRFSHSSVEISTSRSHHRSPSNCLSTPNQSWIHDKLLDGPEEHSEDNILCPQYPSPLQQITNDNVNDDDYRSSYGLSSPQLSSPFAPMFSSGDFQLENVPILACTTLQYGHEAADDYDDYDYIYEENTGGDTNINDRSIQLEVPEGFPSFAHAAQHAPNLPVEWNWFVEAKGS